MPDSIILPVSTARDVLRLSVHQHNLDWDVGIGLDKSWWTSAPASERARVLNAILRALEQLAADYVQGSPLAAVQRILKGEGVPRG